MRPKAETSRLRMKAETSGLRPKAETRWLRLKAKKGGVLVRRYWDLISGRQDGVFWSSFLVLILEVHGFGSYKKEEVLVWHVYFKK